MASPTEVDQSFSKASNNFATELYQKTVEGKSGNVIISPVSIQSAVTMAMLGASGDTRTQMLSGLKYPAGYNNDVIAKNFEQFTAGVKKTNGLKIGKFSPISQLSVMNNELFI
jgi:serine protease inhibitor